VIFPGVLASTIFVLEASERTARRKCSRMAIVDNVLQLAVKQGVSFCDRERCRLDECMLLSCYDRGNELGIDRILN
jgi:hypothetical protein